MLVSLAKSPNSAPAVVSAGLHDLVLNICQVNSAVKAGPAPGCLLRIVAGWPVVWRSALLGVLEGPGKASWCLMLYLIWPEVAFTLVLTSWILGCGLNLRLGADSDGASSSKATSSAPSGTEAHRNARPSFTYVRMSGIIYSWVLITLRGAGSLINTLTSKDGPGLMIQLLADGKHTGALILPGFMLLLERVRKGEDAQMPY